jgi:hypothetical protein
MEGGNLTHYRNIFLKGLKNTTTNASHTACLQVEILTQDFLTLKQQYQPLDSNVR